MNRTQAKAACAYDVDCDLGEKLRFGFGWKQEPIANERGSSRRWFVPADFWARTGNGRRPKPPAPTTKDTIWGEKR